MNRRKFSAAFTAFIGSAFALITTLTAPPQASAEENTCQYHTGLQYDLNMPIYRWCPSGSPKGIVIAMHGLVMHGASFERLGHDLSKEGFLVYATDMRGYGRLTKEYPHEFCGKTDCKQKMNYKKSGEDIVRLTDRLKQHHPSIPLYLVGESLGAAMAIRIASNHPDLVDGIVLSSPAIRAHKFLDGRAFATFGFAATNFGRQLDLTHYMKHYASEDPQVVSEILGDRQVRHSLNTYEILQSYRTVNETLSYVSRIQADKPVLVMQGTEDRCVCANAVPKLMKCLQSRDQKLQWFTKRGHVLIETAYIKPDAMSTLTVWLNDHARESSRFHAAKLNEIIVSDPSAQTAVSSTSD